MVRRAVMLIDSINMHQAGIKIRAVTTRHETLKKDLVLELSLRRIFTSPTPGVAW